MKLSPNTLTVLKNFASINDNLVVDAGSTLQTINEQKTLLANATVEENFPQRFGIFKLNEFLAVYSQLERQYGEPDLNFKDNRMVMSVSDNETVYPYSEPSVLSYPDKQVSLPSSDVVVTITQELLANVLSMASVYKLAKIRIQSTGKGKTVLAAFDENDGMRQSSNKLDHETDKVFDIHFSISNLKMVPADYEVSISKKFISKWDNKSDCKVDYFVAIEKSATFND